jgi:enoyl-CoA hydratase
MRHMVYTCQTATAAELAGYGSVLEVVDRAELVTAARRLATVIAAKDPIVVRAAKQSLNGIDRDDVKRSYRFEQGFTFELNLIGAGDRARAAFLAERK